MVTTTGWQLVTDLPDDEMMVLIYSPAWGDQYLGFHEAGYWYTCEGERCWPTHWHELPESPEGAES